MGEGGTGDQKVNMEATPTQNTLATPQEYHNTTQRTKEAH